VNALTEPPADVRLGILVVALLACVELAKAARWAMLFGPRRPAYPRFLGLLLAVSLVVPRWSIRRA
jgi:hypothetical protein